MITQNQNIVKSIVYFIVYMKTDAINKDIGTKFDTSNYELDRPLPEEKNKKVIGLMIN